MQSTDNLVLETVNTWRQSGHGVWLFTVLETYGSSPRQPGAMCAIRDDGLVVGSVSGGCIETDLIEKVLENAFDAKQPTIVTYGESIEERDRFRLPCGGTLVLVIEKVTHLDWVSEVLSALSRRDQCLRLVDKRTGKSTIQTSTRLKKRAENLPDKLRFVYGPHDRMLLIGAAETSVHLARMASALDYQVIVADPREEMHATWQSDDAELWKMMPDDAVIKIDPDEHTCVITLTHDPKLDDMALLEALKSHAFYVGALGSVRTNANRRQRLAMFDLTAKQIERLHGPVGLAIGSKTPAEIAVAILAELIEYKRKGMRDSVSTEMSLVQHG